MVEHLPSILRPQVNSQHLSTYIRMHANTCKGTTKIHIQKKSRECLRQKLLNAVFKELQVSTLKSVLCIKSFPKPGPLQHSGGECSCWTECLTPQTAGSVIHLRHGPHSTPGPASCSCNKESCVLRTQHYKLKGHCTGPHGCCCCCWGHQLHRQQEHKTEQKRSAHCIISNPCVLDQT